MKRECRSASSAAKIAIQTKEAHFVSAMLVMKGLMDILALLAWLENISQNGAMARVTTAQKGRTQNREVQHHAPDVRQESSQLTLAMIKPRIAQTVKRVNTQKSKEGPTVWIVLVASFQQLLVLMPQIHV